MFQSIQSITKSIMPIVSDCAVTFHPPKDGVRLSAGGLDATLDLVLKNTATLGSTTFVIENAADGGIEGTVSQGATITVAGDSYTVAKSAQASWPYLTITTNPLTGSYSAGTPVAFSASSYTAKVATITSNRGERDFVAEDIKFAFQVHIDDIPLLPRRGWIAHKTSDDVDQMGTIMDVVTAGVMVLVYVGA